MKRALPVVVLLVVAIAVWLATRAPPSGREAAHPTEAAAAPDDPAESTARAIAAAPVEARDAGFAAPDHTVRDRATRDLVRAQIYRAWAEAMGDPTPAQVDPLHAPMPTLDGGRVDPNYLRQRIREDFVPMAASCYEQYQRRAPGQQGRVVMRFVILGDVHAGGVVDEAELEGSDGGLGDGGTGDPEFATCLRESMMAMAFQPPPESGRLRVTYPFTFRPDDAGREAP
ncbi:MAG: AgmX/PglI C-terminal domain-containing protein [Polyangiales bacterium]